MVSYKVGDKFPTKVDFQYIPYVPENSDILACSIPTVYSLSKKLPGRTVVIVSVPGAFTPTCTADHIPPYVAKIKQLRAKGVDDVVVISANDSFVLAAWGKALGAKDEIIFASDPNAAVSTELGLQKDLTAVGFGIRTSRYAAIVVDGVIKYLEEEPGQGVSVSGVESILSALDNI
ncbi:hypothetical protein PACTADRAFT_77462 [Pachysolen tannophilus NRRL Y-2460]|uniref:Thioredoxin peroxidase n=1 Tax=Pachysolen tannophilus NRRL Y-2460 TaxID=669874 RepID=A0A1E4TQD7_PACTA|nr:hypothetical protein PACTADRAFT_77462 [Pachysolen tannophilus NRRL Y-2460]